MRGLEALFGVLEGVFRPETARDLWQVRAGSGAVRVRDTIARDLAALAGTRRVATLWVRTPGRAPSEVHARVERWAPPHVWLVAPGRNAVRVLRADRVLRVSG